MARSQSGRGKIIPNVEAAGEGTPDDMVLALASRDGLFADGANSEGAAEERRKSTNRRR
jgi:hypothetical protein